LHNFLHKRCQYRQRQATVRQQDLGTTGDAVFGEQDRYESRTQLVVHQFGQFKRRTVVPYCVVVGRDLEPPMVMLEKDRHWRIFAQRTPQPARRCIPLMSPIGIPRHPLLPRVARCAVLVIFAAPDP
jgi:hypothetical protein